MNPSYEMPGRKWFTEVWLTETYDKVMRCFVYLAVYCYVFECINKKINKITGLKIKLKFTSVHTVIPNLSYIFFIIKLEVRNFCPFPLQKYDNFIYLMYVVDAAYMNNLFRLIYNLPDREFKK